jgi:hypothetical protein
MKDIKGFCKIFDISVPDYDHFDYYIGQLSKLNKYKDLKELIYLYEQAEDELGNLYEYRMRKSDEIISFLQNTRAYNEMTLDNLIPDYPISKSFQYDNTKKYLSIDMRKANWTVLKNYDPPFANELPNTYDDLLDQFEMPQVFKKSKSLRQYIFGNINPRKQAKSQRVIMQRIIDQFSKLDGINLECIKNDEVIYSYTDIEYLKNNVLDKIDNSQFKIKLFRNEKVEDFRIDFIMDESEQILYREMVGCNGSRFFLLLKKYIFIEKVDIRDLYFRMDGNIAIWKIDNINISLDELI